MRKQLSRHSYMQTLTIRDEDTAQHSAEDDTQGNALEAKGRHVPTGSKSAILLLKNTKKIRAHAVAVQQAVT